MNSFFECVPSSLNEMFALLTLGTVLFVQLTLQRIMHCDMVNGHRQRG